MSDKILDLIEKMYIDLKSSQDKIYKELKDGQDKIARDVSTLKGDVNTLKGDVSTLKGDVSTLKDDFEKLSNQMVRFENGIKEDVRVLYDGYKLTYELAKENNEKLEILSNKIEGQELQIKVIKGGKR